MTEFPTKIYLLVSTIGTQYKKQRNVVIMNITKNTLHQFVGETCFVGRYKLQFGNY